jgi:hypothetical protein
MQLSSSFSDSCLSIRTTLVQNNCPKHTIKSLVRADLKWPYEAYGRLDRFANPILLSSRISSSNRDLVCYCCFRYWPCSFDLDWRPWTAQWSILMEVVLYYGGLGNVLCGVAIRGFLPSTIDKFKGMTPEEGNCGAIRMKLEKNIR